MCNKLFIVLLIFAAASDSCDADDDCQVLYQCESSKCKHKEFIDPEPNEVVALLLMMMASALGNAGGLGGGPMHTSILVLLCWFLIQDALPYTQLLTVGGSIFAVGYKLYQRHPKVDRPAIYYEVIGFVISPLIIGTIIGVELSQFLPEWTIALALIIIIVYVGSSSSLKAYRMGKIEKGQMAVVPQTEEIEGQTEKDNGQGSQGNENTMEKSIMKKEKQIVPINEGFFILLIYLLFILFQFIRGGKTIESIVGIDLCSIEYFIAEVVFIVVLIVITILKYFQLIKRNNDKHSCNYSFDEFDIKWNKKAALNIGVTSLLSGLYSGSIGGSGSLFISMVLIHKHVRPEVVTASSSVLVFIASSTASIQYIVGGYIYLDYGLILFFTSFIGSMIGILMIKKAVEKRGKPSLLVWAFGIQLLIGAVMLTGYQIYHFYTQIEEGDSSFGFNNFC